MYQPEHEKLEVYARALDVHARLESIARALPEYRADVKDQLRRAATSVVLNLAEGANEFSPADKARFYRIARRSGGECLAALDLVPMLAVEPIETASARRALLGVMEALNKMVLAQRRR